MTTTLPPPAVPRSLPLPQTTIGRKVIMAVTGALLYLFVLVHMIGNLK
ncbi:MAG: succinate dehydrogenase, partial [Actinobacteria bacterium]|nr:succinate dehydrogenase [Actinomycetota bacterium]